MVLVYAEEEESVSRAGDDFGEELGEEVVLEWLTLGSARLLLLMGEEKQKHFNFILLILKVHINKDNLKQFDMGLSQLLMYYIPFYI